MSDNQLFSLTRQQIAAFVKDQRTLIAVEKAFRQANVDIPINLDELTSLAETASSASHEAMSRIEYVANELYDHLASVEAGTRAQIEALLAGLKDEQYKPDMATPRIEQLEVRSEESARTLAEVEAIAQMAHDLSISAERRARFNTVMSWLTTQ